MFALDMTAEDGDNILIYLKRLVCQILILIMFPEGIKW